MLPPMLVALLATKKHTPVSFNRVIIVASDQISRNILIVRASVIVIDAKKEMQQDEQRNYTERAAAPPAAPPAAATAVSQHAQM